MNIHGNTVLVTGGTRGIGFALAKSFYQYQNKVIIVGTSETKIEAVLKHFPKMEGIRCDLTSSADIDQLVHQLYKEYPQLNTLINNAGIQYQDLDVPFGQDEAALAEHLKEVRVNFTAPIELTARLIPLLQKNGNASVTNVSSALAFVPKRSAPVYCGTKAGLHIWTKALRYQYEHTSLKFFEIIPPLVDTDMTKGRWKGEMTAEALTRLFIKAYIKNKYEVNIGKTGMLRFLQRLWPSKADAILKYG